MEGAINDQIKESNVALDKTQSMTDANVSSVSSDRKSTRLNSSHT